MKISIDWVGCYLEHKDFFDAMALGLQKMGHKVGIITGERGHDPFNGKDHKEEILKSLGFVPDFMRLWGDNETIGNGALWKAERMDEEDVLIHFDDDARDIKRYTVRDVIKTMHSGEQTKF